LKQYILNLDLDIVIFTFLQTIFLPTENCQHSLLNLWILTLNTTNHDWTFLYLEKLLNTLSFLELLNPHLIHKVLAVSSISFEYIPWGTLLLDMDVEGERACNFCDIWENLIHYFSKLFIFNPQMYIKSH